jgi:SPP1 family predicted phage head-tail adaptor
MLGPKGSYSVQAGAFRHRVTLQKQVQRKDSAGGITEDWVDVATSIPAAMEDLAGGEHISAQQTAGFQGMAISIRWRPGVLQSMRVLHKLNPPDSGTEVFNIEDIQRDTTQRKYITLFCKRRDSDGFRADGR